MSGKKLPEVVIRLRPPDAASAAWLLDLCGNLQQAVWRAYGDEIEAHWGIDEPQQPIYGSPQPRPPKR